MLNRLIYSVAVKVAIYPLDQSFGLEIGPYVFGERLHRKAVRAVVFFADEVRVGIEDSWIVAQDRPIVDGEVMAPASLVDIILYALRRR